MVITLELLLTKRNQRSAILITWFLTFSFEDCFPYEEEAESGEALASLVEPSPTP